MSINLEQLKFPIGQFQKPASYSASRIHKWINDIEEFPKKLKALTQELPSEELNWKYRPNSWTIKQVVHHCADSHMNSLIRFKLALTEEQPNIRPYFEDRWAELSDGVDNNIKHSLLLLTGLHQKWANLLRSLTKDKLDRTFTHPEHGQIFSLKENIGIYAWHCNHHLAHIEQALANQGNFNNT
ncbi:MAG: putative metal-dependent hydrolase [Aureispira sp.]|nr:putative metal-dependent hydrolase [Aureispira sp.]